MQKHVNLVDLVKSFPTNIFLQNLASIQKRTSPIKFAHLAEKSENCSISNLSTKVQAILCKRRRIATQARALKSTASPGITHTGLARSKGSHTLRPLLFGLPVQRLLQRLFVGLDRPVPFLDSVVAYLCVSNCFFQRLAHFWQILRGKFSAFTSSIFQKIVFEKLEEVRKVTKCY